MSWGTEPEGATFATDEPGLAGKANVAQRPRVLVLIATCNGAKAIERQICSVLLQNGVEVVIDVRDDGSTDSTNELVARMAAVDTRIRMSSDRTPSGSAAGNFFALMQMARLEGIDHVAFCDQDDEWFPGKLRRAVDRLVSSGCRGYSSAVCAVWPDGRAKVLGQSAAMGDADFLFEGAGQGCTFVVDARWFECLRRQLERAAALLPDVHYHDWLIYALTRASGECWTFDPSPTMCYHQHADNDTGARTSLAGIVRRLQKLRDGWYRRQVAAVTGAVLAAHPDHELAAHWSGLLRGSRFARLLFVARHGRRRLSDRLIQTIAVGLGRL